MKIHPVKNSGFYITLVDDEYKPIYCIKNYQDIYSKGETYKYRLYKHDETGAYIYVVYFNIPNDDKSVIGNMDVYLDHFRNSVNYFTQKSLSNFFDIRPILRDIKLNSLGID